MDPIAHFGFLVFLFLLSTLVFLVLGLIFARKTGETARFMFWLMLAILVIDIIIYSVASKSYTWTGASIDGGLLAATIIVYVILRRREKRLKELSGTPAAAASLPKI